MRIKITIEIDISEANKLYTELVYLKENEDIDSDSELYKIYQLLYDNLR